MNIVSAVILCTIVGAIGAVVLVLAAKFMAVEEDPRIEEVSACLAGANCGGCGYAGCSDYAKAVVMDGVPCDKCAPGGPKAAAAIAKIMGGEASAVEKKAVVQCQGNSEHCKPSYEYKGIQTCAAAATLYGGPKTCTFACIGLGDCTKVCKFDAIHIVDGVAQVECGNSCMAVIKTDGSLWTWGENGEGTLGHGTTEDTYVPKKILDNVTQVSISLNSTATAYAVQTDGTLWAWGSNNSDYLGFDGGNDTNGGWTRRQG